MSSKQRKDWIEINFILLLIGLFWRPTFFYLKAINAFILLIAIISYVWLFVVEKGKKRHMSTEKIINLLFLFVLIFSFFWHPHYLWGEITQLILFVIVIGFFIFRAWRANRQL